MYSSRLVVLLVSVIAALLSGCSTNQAYSNQPPNQLAQTPTVGDPCDGLLGLPRTTPLIFKQVVWQPRPDLKISFDAPVAWDARFFPPSEGWPFGPALLVTEASACLKPTSDIPSPITVLDFRLDGPMGEDVDAVQHASADTPCPPKCAAIVGSREGQLGGMVVQLFHLRSLLAPYPDIYFGEWHSNGLTIGVALYAQPEITQNGAAIFDRAVSSFKVDILNG